MGKYLFQSLFIVCLKGIHNFTKISNIFCRWSVKLNVKKCYFLNMRLIGVFANSNINNNTIKVNLLNLFPLKLNRSILFLKVFIILINISLVFIISCRRYKDVRLELSQLLVSIQFLDSCCHLDWGWKKFEGKCIKLEILPLLLKKILRKVNILMEWIG